MSITKALSRRLMNYSDPNSFGSKMRRKRLAPLLQMIDDVYREHGEVKLLDIGGTRTFWTIFPGNLIQEKNIHITVLNYELTDNMQDDEHFTFLQGDACNMDRFEDKQFHICHSNSVVEHVGDWARMVDYAREVDRCGQRYMVQTPNFWFPFEPHCATPFFHWLPKPWCVSLVMKFQLGHWEKANNVDEAVRWVDSARLLDRKMFLALFPNAHHVTERLFLLPKSFVAIKR